MNNREQAKYDTASINNREQAKYDTASSLSSYQHKIKLG